MILGRAGGFVGARQRAQDNAVAACYFGGVEAGVGGFDDLVAGGSVFGIGGGAGADGDRARHSRELPGGDQAAQLFRDSQRVLRVGLRKQDGEFFSAVAADHVDLSQLLMEDRRDLAQHFVSQQVAELVVQALEFVDIHHDYAHAGAEAAGAFDFFGNSQFEETAVEDSGQSVQISQLLYALDVMGVLDGGGADVGDGFQWLHFSGAKAPMRSLSRTSAPIVCPKETSGMHMRDPVSA